MALSACAQESPPPQGDTVECALGSGAAFEDICTLEELADSSEFVIHHPDGGFRRFTRLPDGQTFALLGGAELLDQYIEDGLIVLKVDDDTLYRLSPEADEEQAGE